MKNARFSARRVLQGGAAFAALGALGIATAMPAYADTYGWGYASAVGGDGVSETYVTQDQTVSNSFSSGIGGWLTVDGTTTATVDAEGASATTVVDSARILITLDDLEDILDPEADDEEEEEEETDEDDSEDDGEADETDEDGETDGSEDAEPVEGGQDGDDGSSQDSEDLPSEGAEPGGDTEVPAPGADPEPSPSPEPSPTPEADAGSAADTVDTTADDAADEVIELNEENSELVDGGDTVFIEATVTGATVSTSQSWDGDVSHHAFEGNLSVPDEVATLANGEEVVIDLVPVVDQGVAQTEDAGFLWNDAYTNLYLAFSVDGEIVNGYPLAESAAGITTGATDGGGDTGGGDGGDGGDKDDEGDDKTPPRERDKDTLPASDVKDAEPLATTGSPLLGLIAAGAAVAAGGGAAAFLARRKKNNAEVDETATAES
ncbi:hypothetical protein [Nocardiopsis sp. NPDC006832]|uniref:hypothetical protein n=1 Tax=Nocardiopsis sp. NPDC006832 TaxID=3157188 RepID=UPI00340EF0C0